jgi:hypothetical protein
VRQGIHVGIDARRRARELPAGGGDRLQLFQLRPRLDIEAGHARLQRLFDLVATLAHPENTIRSAGMPARRLRHNSPPETMSAPAPASAIRRRIASLLLALIA